MTENLFGTNRHYEDSDGFSQRYFYQLRGCVVPPIKAEKKESEQSIQLKPEIKSRRRISMDVSRNKNNQRHKRK